ncbi:uncharacterized protein LOC134527753 isoform X1 [Bacillus rossius redtenbacheri]|uniref:uncharacterized protein LOC134527753 isoform X1 n=1 Tax=Bacillus rossius redtenbacheri TaxID=93214 RepID=UPI002FDE2702
MSRQQSERSIPHLRDIFGFHGGWGARQEELVVQQKLQDMRLGAADRSGAGNDSAVSVGSASEDELPRSCSPGKKKKQRSSRRDNARTLTERDVKHLERHLSMKKTIRKKIMRDLQQAFVEDPSEFRVEDISPEQLKAEINIQSLSFGAPHTKAGKKAPAESNFLDMLRGANNSGGTPGGKLAHHDDDDSGHGSPTRESSTHRLAGYEDDEDEEEDYREPDAGKKTSFWRRFAMKGRSKR